MDAGHWHAAGVPKGAFTGPFTLDDARAAGLSRGALRGSAWRRIASRLYVPTSGPMDTWKLLKTWKRLLPTEAVFSARTAVWMHGLPLKVSDVVYVVTPPRTTIHRAGVLARRCRLAESDVVTVKGLRATTLHRALADLCFYEQPVEVLVAIDMALHKRLTDRDKLLQFARTAVGIKRIRLFRLLAELGEPAQSPMETRLRWLLREAGLPRPLVQVELYDDFGDLIGIADLYYPKHRLVIEYDGANHRDRLVSDDRRQNLLMREGYRILRFTAPDVFERPDFVANQVRGELAAPPAAPPSREAAGR